MSHRYMGPLHLHMQKMHQVSCLDSRSLYHRLSSTLFREWGMWLIHILVVQACHTCAVVVQFGSLVEIHLDSSGWGQSCRGWRPSSTLLLCLCSCNLIYWYHNRPAEVNCCLSESSTLQMASFEGYLCMMLLDCQVIQLVAC